MVNCLVFEYIKINKLQSWKKTKNKALKTGLNNKITCFAATASI